MKLYTVTSPGGSRDWEYLAYVRLLEDIGIDVSNSPRVPEPGTSRQWLYAWRKEIEAERFAEELRRRTGYAGWTVHSFDVATEKHGPVAPLDIARVLGEDGYTYYLTPASRERIATAFPGRGLPPSLRLPIDVEQDFRLDKGEEGWMEVARLLTGLTDDEIDSLGGVTIIAGENGIVLRRIPEVV